MLSAHLDTESLSRPRCSSLLGASKEKSLISLGSAVWRFFSCLEQIPPLEVKFT